MIFHFVPSSLLLHVICVLELLHHIMHKLRLKYVLIMLELLPSFTHKISLDDVIDIVFTHLFSPNYGITYGSVFMT